ncbi:UDP-N-acetylglucosamine 1-carboxyvinyltransferase [Streptomyces beijiangensis]|uniref:UDP-N-acetylglucosamine 1-carboxyvinyltransferase n=1 Tax=Streptomyces beijiangensis TaxID=163361 RepID=A0A939JF22_9ACTN|nr:UDP-N-acetylglucosamine 1-carboxyvinyltransferase [Streptomyces beijiangensis]MBO0511953.1 UDP-N-acetylglucosamine 1-carboxyvinyltransferase [Streptomyces beijiangensis]
MVAVRPSIPLVGSVTVDGSKNAALPLLAAATAMRRPVHLSNVPANTDVETMLILLQQAGWHAGRPLSDPHTVVILPSDKPQPDPEPEVAARIRASYYLVPALLGAYGRARLPWPGGCAIGERGMEQHFKVYERFGDRTTVDDRGYLVKAATSGDESVSIMLPFRSRGASIAALLRAVVAGRPLRLGGPNLSPEVVSVVDALEISGWECRVSETVLALQPPRSVSGDALAWRVPGDKIEAGTLACAVAVSGGNADILGVGRNDVAPLVTALRWLGVPAAAEDGTLSIQAQDTQPTGRPLRAIASLSPGGLDADFEPPLIALALTLPGTHLFADDINPGRHGNLLPQLMRLGAAIDELSPTQCRFTGPQQLTGTGVEATDIRTGSALLIAGLTARGVTTLGGLEQLRRGHADLPVKLHALGADICEVRP